MRKPLKAALFLGVFAFTAALAINFCNLVFQCGCQSIWAAADAHCNIHHKHGPHCPWCTHGGAGFVVSMVPVFIAQGWFTLRNNSWSWKQRLFASLAAFPLIGGVLGVIVGWSQGYWNH